MPNLWSSMRDVRCYWVVLRVFCIVFPSSVKRRYKVESFCAIVLLDSYLLCNSLFPCHSGISWTLLDESYVDSCTTSKARPEDWKAFLAELGVQHFLAIERKQVKLHRGSMVSLNYNNDIRIRLQNIVLACLALFPVT